MNYQIKNWTAHLNNGAVLTQDTKLQETIDWPIPHWPQEANRLKTASFDTSVFKDCKLEHFSFEIQDIPFQEAMTLRELDAVLIDITLEEKPEHILSYYMFNDWWTRPHFCNNCTEIPDRTNLILLQSAGSYTAFLAMPGHTFKAKFISGSKENCLTLSLAAYRSGYRTVDENFLMTYSDTDPYRCLEVLMKQAAEYAGIPSKGQRVYPEMFDKIGWCSWDAFYQDITEEKVIAKMQEIKEKEIPFVWILLDDGWSDVKDFRLRNMAADPVKFPNNLQSTVKQIKEMTDAKHVGVWHAFSGYWSGLEKGSEIYEQLKDYTIETMQGKIIPAPEREKAYAFFAKWYDYLSKQGIDFVKVDSQSTAITHYRNNAPIGASVSQLHQGLDQAVIDYMNGNLINCMGMGTENVLARPSSAMSRNSDDFFPNKENGFEEHLLQNTYNSLYHTHLYHGDWDMFWSSHPDAEKHAIIRALSGGPVYVSDKIGETKKEILSNLCYEDGTILRADQPAVPTKDCIFQDPAACGYLKIKNTCNGVGYLAIFNYSTESVDVPYQISDVFDADKNMTYAVYGRFSQKGFTATAEETFTCTLPGKGFELFMIAPVMDGYAVFGADNKYLASHVLKDISTSDCINILTKEYVPVLLYTELETFHATLNNQETTRISSKGNGFYVIS